MTQHRTREEQIKELSDELMFETGMGDGTSLMTAQRHAVEFEARAIAALQAENERLRQMVTTAIPLVPERYAQWHLIAGHLVQGKKRHHG